MSNVKIDVVIDCLCGDNSKGKIAHFLCDKGDTSSHEGVTTERTSVENKPATNPQSKYTHVVRFNGGGNCGHTIYHAGQKFVTHYIPCGVFHGITSIIGPGCVVNPEKLFEEIKTLEDGGIDVKPYLRIAKNTHIVTQKHLDEDSKDTSVGTTKTGNGPAFRDKYAREGIRAESIESLKPYIVDMYTEFYMTKGNKYILAEGAQGFFLDPDWGAYPYVTSSHCGIGAVLNNGFNHKQINKVYAAAKVYETYVGAMKFEPDEEIFKRMREVGGEYGATTGRPRQCNWLDLNRLNQAIEMNGVDILCVCKVDIFRTLNVWKVTHNGKLVDLQSEENFCRYIRENVPVKDIRFSDNPNTI